MIQKTSDQGWQQLEAHVDGFFAQVLGGNVQKIEYKRLFITKLLEMPAERLQNEFLGIMAISSNVQQTGGGT